MTANRRQATALIVVAIGLSATGLGRAFGFHFVGMEAIVGLAALVPLALVVGLIWFGREVLMTLRGIESTLAAADAQVTPEFTRGS